MAAISTQGCWGNCLSTQYTHYAKNTIVCKTNNTTTEIHSHIRFKTLQSTCIDADCYIRLEKYVWNCSCFHENVMCVHVHKFRFHGNCICVCGIPPPKASSRPNSSLFFLLPQWILHAKVLLSLSYKVPYEEAARWIVVKGKREIHNALRLKPLTAACYYLACMCPSYIRVCIYRYICNAKCP